MISYEKACEIARRIIHAPEFEGLNVAYVNDLPDMWSFAFSVLEGDGITSAPSFFVHKKDGRVQWYNLCALKNPRSVLDAKELDFIW